MTLERITILGSGTMGAGIAQTAMSSGFATTLYDISDELVQKAKSAISDRLEKLVEKGKIDAPSAAAAKARLRLSSNLADAVRDADYVIEAIPEKIALKREVFAKIEAAAPSHAVLGTNTSTLMISAIARDLSDRSRLIGIHFFNPVPVMKLIEVVMGPDTSPSAYAATLAVAKRMGKETARVKGSPGFTSWCTSPCPCAPGRASASAPAIATTRGQGIALVAASDPPGRYSTTMWWVSLVVKSSSTSAMLGWPSRRKFLDSCSSRSSRSGAASVSARSRDLIATGWPESASLARKTTPNPPSPICASTR